MAFKTLIFAGLLALCVAQETSLAPGPSGPPGSSPPPPPPPPPPMPKMPCVTAGFMCSDCNNQAVCIGDGSGGFTQIENLCAPESHCVDNKCVQGAKCNYRPFKCSDEGFFPDPFDCTKYYVCVRQGEDFTQLDMNCDGSSSYDASSGSCGFPLNSTACTEGPVPRCTEALQIGGLTSDPSVYYLCTEDVDSTGPQLYKCAGGKIFDPKKVSCVSATKKSKK